MHNNDTFSDRSVLSQVATIEQQLEVQSSDIKFENITLENLKHAAEMFIYLKTKNPCTDSLKEWLNVWETIYSDIFENHSPPEILLALNRMMRSNQTVSDEGKVKTVLERTASFLSLNGRSTIGKPLK